MKNLSFENYSIKNFTVGRLFLAFAALICLAGCLGQKGSKEGALPKVSKKDIKQANITPVKNDLKKGVLQTASGEATLEEMIEQINLETEKGQHAAAAQWLEKVIRRYPENPKLVDYRYKLAESYFLAKKYPLAAEAFLTFSKFYPADPREADARYFALMSKYNYSKSFSVECDSSITKEVVELGEKLLADESMFSRKEEIILVLNHCGERLLNKEVAVFDSYLRRGKFDAAEVKLDKIKSEYLAKNKTIEPRVVYLECKLAKKTNDSKAAQSCLDLLLEKYPESKFTRMASGLVSTDIGIVSELILG